MRTIVLASSSPRRKEILAITGLSFTVCESDYEEDLGLSLTPRALARFLSRKKAEAVAAKFVNAIIIAADTFIIHRGNLLGKPRSKTDAQRMLASLGGTCHSVITGYTVADTEKGRILSRSVETKVHFRNLLAREIADYVRSGEPMGKAGAYAIQGLGAVLVEKIEGDFFNVMGLPLCSLAKNLKTFGIDVLGRR